MSSIVHCDICEKKIRRGFISGEPHGKLLRYKVQKLSISIFGNQWKKFDICNECIREIIEKRGQK